MSLETPNRIHASAVCFWQTKTDPNFPLDDVFDVGMQARQNFSTIALPEGPNSPSIIVLDLVQPIAKAEAIPMAFATGDPANLDKSGISVGPPLTPTSEPSINNVRDDQVVVAELDPPPRVNKSSGAADGSRAFFYVMVLGLPPSEEQVFIQPPG